MRDKSYLVDVVGALATFSLISLALFDGISSRGEIRVIDNFTYRGQTIEKVCQHNRFLSDGVPYFRFQGGARFNLFDKEIIADDGKKISRE